MNRLISYICIRNIVTITQTGKNVLEKKIPYSQQWECRDFTYKSVFQKKI